MIFESCSEIRSYFSDYIDGVCDTPAIRSIRYHLANCPPCNEDLEHCRTLRAELRGLERQHVPRHLALRLRVRASQEFHRNALQCVMVRLENMLRPVFIPAVAGLLVALVCISLVLGEGTPRSNNIPDVPLSLVTSPRIQEMAPLNFDTEGRPLVLVTYVNAHGEVTSYRVLSGPHSPQLMERLDRMMYFSVFQPATSFGVPTSGRVVLSFRRITVRG
ncbi:MAG TPA: zf-HC2 domain-containing protein [Terriglobia bacterium]|nr:zf-HC2 domain-containing protein [Terriglobia bacterium]